MAAVAPGERYYNPRRGSLKVRAMGRLAIVVAAVLVAAGSGHGQPRSPLVPVGDPVTREGLRLSFGYLPVAVTFDGGARSPEGGSAIHLQLDVDAARGNPYGFEPDDSVPYLQISFTLTQDGTGRRIDGILEPMVSRDGFHYGANVLLPGPGPYVLAVEIRPPEKLARHTDPRTGVLPWWTPFSLTWNFRPTP
jgi:periplasmic iron binding protein